MNYACALGGAPWSLTCRSCRDYFDLATGGRGEFSPLIAAIGRRTRNLMGDRLRDDFLGLRLDANGCAIAELPEGGNWGFYPVRQRLEERLGLCFRRIVPGL